MPRQPQPGAGAGDPTIVGFSPHEQESKAVTCPSCGNRFMSDSRFCRMCGMKRPEMGWAAAPIHTTFDHQAGVVPQAATHYTSAPAYMNVPQTHYTSAPAYSHVPQVDSHYTSAPAYSQHAQAPVNYARSSVSHMEQPQLAHATQSIAYAQHVPATYATHSVAPSPVAYTSHVQAPAAHAAVAYTSHVQAPAAHAAVAYTSHAPTPVVHTAAPVVHTAAPVVHTAAPVVHTAAPVIHHRAVSYVQPAKVQAPPIQPHVHPMPAIFWKDEEPEPEYPMPPVQFPKDDVPAPVIHSVTRAAPVFAAAPVHTVAHQTVSTVPVVQTAAPTTSVAYSAPSFAHGSSFVAPASVSHAIYPDYNTTFHAPASVSHAIAAPTTLVSQSHVAPAASLHQMYPDYNPTFHAAPSASYNLPAYGHGSLGYAEPTPMAMHQAAPATAF